MTMFIGEYQHTLDDKSRLAVPAKFRAALKGGAVVTRGLDNCLFLFTRKDWAALVEKLARLPIGQKDARGFSRAMLGGAMDVKLDSLGRILLPEYLKIYAGLKKKTVLVGLYSRLEIWDEKRWQIYSRNNQRQVEGMAEKMGELGV
jgi:MraZ protein